MIKSLAILVLLTLIPGLELRASIPYGMLSQSIETLLPWPAVAIFCWLANIVVGWGFFFILQPLLNLIRKIPFLDKLFVRYLQRAQDKLRPAVEKYGVWGFALFIGIPLPLTGAYTGAAGAFALGMRRRDFIIANVIGVTIAAIAVTVIVLLIRAGIQSPIFDMLIKRDIQ